MAAETTHVATTPNKPAPLSLDGFRMVLAKEYTKSVRNFFDGDEDRVKKFMSAVVYSVQKNGELLKCEPASLMNAFMSCAEFQLYPSNVAGEAYVIPYKGKAQFQLGYQGNVTLLNRLGITVRTQIVKANDFFEYEEGMEQHLIHRPNMFGDRGDAIGVYAVVTHANGTKEVKVMSAEDVMKFKKFSKSKDSEFSPWNPANDPELWTWRKTCIKQLTKTISKSETLQKAIALDNEDSIISDRKANLDLKGPGAGKAVHDPEAKVTDVEIKALDEGNPLAQREEEQEDIEA